MVIFSVMMTRHFLKTLIMFSGMIILGLLGVFLVSYFDRDGVESTDTTSTCEEGEVC